MSKLQLGVNEGISNQLYHEDKEYLSSSVLKVVYEDLAKYYDEYILGNKKEYSQSTLDAFAFGTSTHTALLEPHLYSTEVLHFNGIRKAGEEWQKFFNALSDEDKKKPIMNRGNTMKLNEILKNFKAHKHAPKFIDHSKPNCYAEHTLCDILHDVPVKVRTDWIDLDTGFIADVKTTSAITDTEAFRETVQSLKYQLSGALYCTVAESIYNKPFDFYFVVVSKADLGTAVYKLSKKSKEEGIEMIKIACAKYLKAKESGDWAEPLQEDTQEDVIPEV